MNPAPGFNVGISGATREKLARLGRHAAFDEQGAKFLAAVRDILARLHSDPSTYGEELFDLRAMKITIKIAVRYPLAVEFGVYSDRREVIVRTFHYPTPVD